MGALKATMDVHISIKFGGLLSGISAVNAAQLWTAGISQHSGEFIYVYQGAARLCFASTRYGAALICWAGYTLNFAMHF